MVEIIRGLCRERKLTLRELERKAGFPRGCVYKWDAHSPSIDKVQKVAAILDVTVNDLIKEEG